MDRVAIAPGLRPAGGRLRALCAGAGLPVPGPIRVHWLKRNRDTSVTTVAVCHAATGQIFAALKIARRSNPAGMDALAREGACLEALERAGVAAPRLLARGGGGTLLLREWQAGGPPRQRRLSPARLADFADLLARIHRIRPEPGTPLPTARLADRLRRCEDNLATLPSADRRNLQPFAERLRRLRPPEGPVGLIHGDISPDNLVVGPGGEVSLIDWAEASFGPAGCDLGAVVNALPAGPGGLAAFLARYSGEGMDSADLQWFAALDSWTRCINLASNGAGYRTAMRRLDAHLASAASARTPKSPKALSPASST